MHRRVRGLAVAFVLTMSVAAPAHAQTDWVQLGSTGIRTGALSADRHIFAVAKNWPIARLILLQQDKDVLRSLDGGATWEAVALPPGVTQVRLPGDHVAFAVGASGLYRSTDDAATWQIVVPAANAGQLSLVGGAALFLADGQAVVSADGGASWTQLKSPIEDASFSGLQLSSDHTLSAVVNGKAFVGDVGSDAWTAVGPGEDVPVETLVVAPDDSLLATVATSDPPSEEDLDPDAVPDAILVSRDGGASWQPAQGMEVDGLPYHWHAFIQLSPTFAKDQTAFAFAYAPWRLPGTPAFNFPMIRRALFRSDDGGLTWHSVFEREALAPTDGGERLVLSPDFAGDHFGVLWSVNKDIIGRGSTCRVNRTDDGGETWTVARAGGTSYLSGDLGCRDMAVGGPPGHLAAVMQTYYGPWEVLTTTPPAGAGLPNDNEPTSSTALADTTTMQITTANNTIFAARVDGSVWCLPAPL